MTDMTKELKFEIKTLGCKVNQYEEQAIREKLLRLGFSEAGGSEADIFIVNSCSVTARADAKTKQAIRRARKENPSAKIFVTGCYAVMEEDIEKLKSMPEVHGVVPGGEKMTLPEVLGFAFLGRTTPEADTPEQVSWFSSHTRAFLKVQDGCDRKCSYCKVNIVRGPSTSRDEKEILAEVERLVAGGYREIVLTGICLGSWKGENGRSLVDLIRAVDALSGDFRIRVSSIEPDQIHGDLVNAIAGSVKVCRHLHIPMQSGSDRILKVMNRRYASGDLIRTVAMIREKMPLAGITMDIIAGFPGEEEEDFQKTVSVVKEIKPSRLHVFRYSDRKGTVSYGLPGKISKSEAQERVKTLISLGEDLQKDFCGKFIGAEVEVLLEKFNGDSPGDEICPNGMEGYSGEYLRTRVCDDDASSGGILMVKITAVDENAPVLISNARRIKP
ncbi:MAG: tRNA (N(6)-L-threonylcarbamoyladenosine(37)-C(2))-methylthiotransferase MtaB [Candidatus Tantalella remota]|nr:tRNA (N(6)-L-threonylcarbamoyladenosine(37)-C(2))-methylthiotransferase MtaB [Candidatus Tantalella remota]